MSIIRIVLFCTLVSIAFHEAISLDTEDVEAATNSTNRSTESVNITELPTESQVPSTSHDMKVQFPPKPPIPNIFEDLFGSSLYRWNTTTIDSAPPVLIEQSLSSLLREGSADAVAVYFSASWCGPCRKFTPILAQAYADINKKLGTKLSKGQANRRFEVIWVTRDNSFEEFVKYFSSMPWLAVPFDKVKLLLPIYITLIQ